MEDLARRLTEAYIHCGSNFSRIRLFRRVALAGSSAVSGSILKECFAFQVSLQNAGWKFPKANNVLGPDWRIELATQMSDSMLLDARTAVDAASLVFAHSILDDLASECCRISSFAAPQEWASAIEKRKVALADLKNSSFQALYDSFLSEYLDQLAREPLMKRLDLLNQKCQPAPTFSPEGRVYIYDVDRIRGVDLLRHEIIHRVALNRQFPSIEEDLKYLEETCCFLVFLVNQRYQLPLDIQSWLQTRVRSKSGEQTQ